MACINSPLSPSPQVVARLWGMAASGTWSNSFIYLVAWPQTSQTHATISHRDVGVSIRELEMLKYLPEASCEPMISFPSFTLKLNVSHSDRLTEFVHSFQKFRLRKQCNINRFFFFIYQRKIIYNTFNGSSVNCPVEREPQLLGLNGSDKQPDCVTLYAWKRGRQLVWNYTCAPSWQTHI